MFYFVIRNNILFTPTQVEAIRSGMQPGLTLVVGPPGTGKEKCLLRRQCEKETRLSPTLDRHTTVYATGDYTKLAFLKLSVTVTDQKKVKHW